MNTIRTSSEIELVLKNSRRFNGKVIRILVKDEPTQRDQTGRVAFIAGKKLGNAVKRNRSKRVMREAARILDLPVPGYDIILMATSRTSSTPTQEVMTELVGLLKRAGLSDGRA